MHRFWLLFTFKWSKHKEYRQCTYNVTSERVRVTICCSGKVVCVTYCERVCSLSYPARKSHAPYYIVICGLSGCTFFCPTLPHKRHDFRWEGEKLIITCVFWFSLQSFSGTPVVLRRIRRGNDTKALRTSCTYRLLCCVFRKEWP